MEELPKIKKCRRASGPELTKHHRHTRRVRTVPHRLYSPNTIDFYLCTLLKVTKVNYSSVSSVDVFKF